MTDRLIEAQAVNEMMRLNMLESFQKPDAGLSSSMQSITRLAMKLLDVPSAMVVLVGKEDLIPLSRTGAPVPDVPRQDSFCTEAIKGDGLLVVANAVEDDRFSKTALVKAGIRFYAGAPLTVDGHLNVGTLGVFDTRPRDLSEADMSGMEDLAQLASDVLEAHRARRHSRSRKRVSTRSRVLEASLEEKNLYLELSERTAGVGHWRVDLATREVNWSDEMYRIHMLSKEEHQPDLESGIGFFHPDDQNDVRMAVDAALAEQKPFRFQKRLIRRDGDTRHVRCRGEIQGAEFGSGGILFGILQDVTESVRAQQQLQLSEQRLATAVESTGAGLWDWNVGTETLYWSPRYREIIGLVDDDFIPTNSYFNSLLHPDDRREVVATLVAHVQKHEQFSELFRMAHQDGHYVWVKCSGRPIWDEQGQPLRIVGAIDDISEQMELEQDLRQRTSELQLIFDNVPARIWYKDDENTILRLNRQAADSMGVSVEDAEGKNTYDLFPEMAAKYHEDDLKVMRSGEPELSIIEPYTPAQGESGWVKTDKIPYTDPVTGRDTVLVVSADITSEMEAQEALYQSEQRFAAAASGASVGIWDWVDVTTSEEWWSPIFYELLGYEPGEIQSSLEAFRDLVHEDDVQRTFDLVDAHFKDETPFRLEYRLRTKSGEYRWFLGSGLANRDESGHPVQMIGSIMDIHELKMTQEALSAHAALLERSNEDLDHFAYIASHDLRAPLRGMKNVAHWIEEDIGPDTSDDIRKKLSLLVGRVDRMDRLLSDILEYSRAGKRDSAPELIDCNTILKEVIEWVEPPEGFTIVAESPLPEIKVSSTLLQQTFLNLVSNSIKHHDKKIGVVRVTYRDIAEHHEFTIEDDGPGIPPEFQDKIFKMFQTIRRRDEVEGSGIGLAIVKKMIEAYGGTVQVRSPLGERGTAFTFTIPKIP